MTFVLTANSEATAQEIGNWKAYSTTNMWYAVRVICWLGQGSEAGSTTLYYKWQKSAAMNGYSAYNHNRRRFTISFNGVSSEADFALGVCSGTAWVDIYAGNLQIGGSGSGTLSVNGYKFWTRMDPNDAISYSTTLEFTESSDTTEGITPPEEAPRGQRYSIYYGGQMIYSPYIEDLGILKANLTKDINSSDQLSLEIPSKNSMGSFLTTMQGNIDIRQGKETIFRGRIVDDESDFNLTGTINAEGFLSYLSDIYYNYSEFSFTGAARDLFKKILDEYNAKLPESWSSRSIFYVDSDITTEVVYEDEPPTKCRDLINSIIEQCGGYLKPEYYSDGSVGLSYVSSYNEIGNQTIEFGKNLLDLTIFTDASSVVTAILPIGKDGLHISGNIVKNDDAVEKYGLIMDILEDYEIETESELREYAEATLLSECEPSVSITINAVDLHLVDDSLTEMRLGCSYRIYSPPHGIDGYYTCIGMNLDLLDPQNNSYTFGESSYDLSDMIE